MAEYLVVLAGVAINTLKADLAHVNVNAGVGIVEALVQVAMFDGVAAAAVEVATAAVLARRPAHAAGRGGQVNALGRVAGRGLAIGARVGVTDEAVHVGLLGKVERRIFPTIPGMARSAAGPVALDANAEVVELVLLTDGHQFVAAGQLQRLALPRPVGRLHHLRRRRLVTLQAGGRHLLPRGIGAGHERGVVGVGRGRLHVGPRIG